MGWRYGSTTEDILTGLSIHNKGWKSIICTPDPPGFLGCAPTGGPDSMTQQKRWATGLLEILLSKNCPIFGTLFANLQFRMFLCYFWALTWGLRCIPELCYAALPAYSIITNTHFLPKVRDIYTIPHPLNILVFMQVKLIFTNRVVINFFFLLKWWQCFIFLYIKKICMYIATLIGEQI